MKQLRIGFIGCGRIAALHAQAYLTNPDALIYAVCSTSLKEAKTFAAKWRIPKVYKTYNELLADPDIDAVEILTPHQTHLKITIDSALANKHISLQKVPVMTLAEFDELNKIITEQKVKFRVFENFRYHKPYVKAFELVNSGKMGKVKTINQRMWASTQTSKEWNYPLKALAWRMTDEANYASPTIFDDGFHKHSIAQLFLPKIESVQVWNQKAKLNGIIPLDTPSLVIYQTQSKDTYGTWNVSLYPKLTIKSHYYSCDEFVEITLERGIILIYGCTGSMFAERASNLDWLDEKGIWHYERVPNSDWKYSFIEATKEFTNAINGHSKLHLNFAEARQILKITLAAVKSLKMDGIKVSTLDQEVASIKPNL